jgi:hypothetical protein
MDTIPLASGTRVHVLRETRVESLGVNRIVKDEPTKFCTLNDRLVRESSTNRAVSVRGVTVSNDFVVSANRVT